MAKFQGSYLSKTIATTGSASEQEVIAAPGAGLKIRVVSYAVVVGGASPISFRTGTGGTAASDKVGPLPFSAAGQGLTERAERGDFLFDCGSNERLSINQAGAFTTGGRVGYRIVPDTLGDE